MSAFSCLLQTTPGADWARFRGPNGSGVSPDDMAVPTKWSDTENVKWKQELPGPGLSCPIVVGDRVVVTCWTGYAAGGEEQGSLDDLKRSVLCLDRNTGEKIWSHEEPAVLPEDNYGGMFAQNGYASHTPVSDGERVYVFYGKSGVLAFDLGDGRKLWQVSVGENRERRGWGSASSPIICDGKVIVPAFIESDSLVAIDGKSGEIVWKQETPGYTSNWSTPIVVEADGQKDLVISVPGEIWGLNPDNGKLRWYCEIPGSEDSRASVVAHGDVFVVQVGAEMKQVAVNRFGADGGEYSSTPAISNGELFIRSTKAIYCIAATK